MAKPIMKISQLYTYPIKSLRGVALSSSEVTRHGFPYDRRFMILKLLDDGSHRNMTITYFPEMALFSQELQLSCKATTPEVLVTFHNPNTDTQAHLNVPLLPNVEGLEVTEIILHKSPTKAYIMQTHFNDWFSECFDYRVMLVYLGPHLRSVLGNLSPNRFDSEGAMVRSWLPSITRGVSRIGSMQRQVDEGLTFADVAPYLVVTAQSLEDVSSRLPEGEDMDITKFRPNIVLSGSGLAYDEDFWGELIINSVERNASGYQGTKLVLTQNCARCVSLNVDYATGKAGTGESGSILKKLMSDRRVDEGAKYSPIFGRYGFLDLSCAEGSISLGDDAHVTKRNLKRTAFRKLAQCILQSLALITRRLAGSWELSFEPTRPFYFESRSKVLNF